MKWSNSGTHCGTIRPGALPPQFLCILPSYRKVRSARLVRASFHSMRLRTIKPTLRTMATGLRSVSGTTNPDSWRVGKTTAERGYGGRWQRARRAFLAQPENVLCRSCAARGRTVVATVVDHIIAHQGDESLFWDVGNWQPLCKRCHDRKTAAEESGSGRSMTHPEWLPTPAC